MHEANGLSFMRARYYVPSAGRFINPDPIGIAGGLNLYRYVQNDPVDFVDPSGLSGKKKIIGWAADFIEWGGKSYKKIEKRFPLHSEKEVQQAIKDKREIILPRGGSKHYGGRSERHLLEGGEEGIWHRHQEPRPPRGTRDSHLTDQQQLESVP
jgi:uncharacterized protein RhaS with RHS repeats